MTVFNYILQVYTRLTGTQGDSVDTCPQFFRCHPNLDDEVNRNIVESEIEGGAFLEDLPARAMLQIQTQHRWYTVVHRGRGEAWIWGHPAFCPEPVLVRIEGSSWGGSMLKIGFVGRGMHLEFRHPALSHSNRDVANSGNPPVRTKRIRTDHRQNTKPAPPTELQ